jgi:hypothetical protein
MKVRILLFLAAAVLAFPAHGLADSCLNMAELPGGKLVVNSIGFPCCTFPSTLTPVQSPEEGRNVLNASQGQMPE